MNQAKGNFDGPHQAYQINANDQLTDAARTTSRSSSRIATARRCCSPTWRSVIDDVENAKLAAWMNSTPAVIVNIQRQPGANIIQVVDRVKELLPQLKSQFAGRQSMLPILTDRTTTIRASVHDVQFSLMLTIALVVMAIFLFLRNAYARRSFRASPCRFSLVGTFGVMYLLGYSLDNLTLDGADHLHGLRRG